MLTWVFLERLLLLCENEIQRQIDAPWVFGVETKDRKARDELRDHLALHGIETRSLGPFNPKRQDFGL